MTSEENNALMTRYGITSKIKTVYFYKQYRYDNFDDALRFAEADAERVGDNVVSRKPIENSE